MWQKRIEREREREGHIHLAVSAISEVSHVLFGGRGRQPQHPVGPARRLLPLVAPLLSPIGCVSKAVNNT